MEENKLSKEKLQGLDKYWILIGTELCSVKRVCRYLEMGPSEPWQDFGFVGWSEKKYSNEQVLNFVKSPEFVTIFEHYLKVGDEIIKENEETREQDAKRRKIAQDEEDKKKREENARLSQLTRGERKLELESMKIPDLKNFEFISQKWRELSKDEKQPYEELSIKDKERYLADKEIYDKEHPEEEDDEKPERKRKKKVKMAGEPSKPLSAFFLFMKDERPNLMAAQPELKFADIGKLLGEKWRAMSAEEKAPFNDRYAQEKERYEKALKKFQAEHPEQ